MLGPFLACYSPRRRARRCNSKRRQWDYQPWSRQPATATQNTSARPSAETATCHGPTSTNLPTSIPIMRSHRRVSNILIGGGGEPRRWNREGQLSLRGTGQGRVGSDVMQWQWQQRRTRRVPRLEGLDWSADAEVSSPVPLVRLPEFLAPATWKRAVSVHGPEGYACLRDKTTKHTRHRKPTNPNQPRTHCPDNAEGA
jgi:hypothetical protein